MQEFNDEIYICLYTLLLNSFYLKLLITPSEIAVTVELTHLSQMEFPTHQLDKPISVLRAVLSSILILIDLSVSKPWRLIRSRRMWHLNLVYTVCICPTKRR